MPRVPEATRNVLQTNTMDLNILQLNTQGSKEVASDLRKHTENQIDILVLQEPYSLTGKVKGYTGLRGRVFQPRSAAPRTAIVVNNPGVDVLQLDTGNSSHVVAIQVITSTCEFYIISAYFQFSHPVEPYLATLEEYIGRIRNNNMGSEVIVCAVNALGSHELRTKEGTK